LKPPPFQYLRARTVDDALSALASDDQSKVLAGGQSLLPLLNMRLARPSLLIDIGCLDELAGIRADGDGITIGATTRHIEVERSPVVAENAPLMMAALRYVGHIGIRTRGTFGGSAAHADPAAEVPAVLLALDAQMQLTGPNGSRAVPADEFFVSYFTTALADDEILSAIHIPAAARDRSWGFVEVSRRHGDFALVGAAVTATVNGDGTCNDARVALLGVGDRVVRARAAEVALEGVTLDDAAAVDAAAKLAVKQINPTGDVHASSEYRVEVTSTVVRRALEQLNTRGVG
jgi:carbon-monoxide dehydrogenase medium subunit